MDKGKGNGKMDQDKKRSSGKKKSSMLGSLIGKAAKRGKSNDAYNAPMDYGDKKDKKK
jgi:hypothetical protein